jgi:hypothetical protein
MFTKQAAASGVGLLIRKKLAGCQTKQPWLSYRFFMTLTLGAIFSSALPGVVADRCSSWQLRPT